MDVLRLRWLILIETCNCNVFVVSVDDKCIENIIFIECREALNFDINVIDQS